MRPPGVVFRRFYPLLPDLRATANLLNRFNLICPTGLLADFVSSPFCKNILFFRIPKSVYILRRPPHRGAYRDRHGRGAGCGGRGGADDESACSRTAKTCGPDAPTLASSLRSDPRNDGGKKADHRGATVF